MTCQFCWTGSFWKLLILLATTTYHGNKFQPFSICYVKKYVLLSGLSYQFVRQHLLLLCQNLRNNNCAFSLSSGFVCSLLFSFPHTHSCIAFPIAATGFPLAQGNGLKSYTENKLSPITFPDDSFYYFFSGLFLQTRSPWFR